MTLKFIYFLLSSYVFAFVVERTSSLNAINLYPIIVDTNGVASVYIPFIYVAIALLIFYLLIYFIAKSFLSKRDSWLKFLRYLAWGMMIVYINSFVYMIFGVWVNQFILNSVVFLAVLYGLLRLDIETKNLISKHIFVNRFNKDDAIILSSTIKSYEDNLIYLVIFIFFGVFIHDPALLILFNVLVVGVFFTLIHVQSYNSYRKKHPFAFARPTEFIFIRTAENEWDEHGIITGTNDINLTPSSIEKIYEIKDILEKQHFNFDEMIIAPNLSSQMTAAILNEELKLKTKQVRYLKSRKMGQAEGQPIDFWKEEIKLQDVEGMETENALITRMRSFLAYLAHNYSAKRVLIICDEDIIRSCLIAISDDVNSFHDIHIDPLKFARIAKSESGTNNFQITDVNKIIKDLF